MNRRMTLLERFIAGSVNSLLAPVLDEFSRRHREKRLAQYSRAGADVQLSKLWKTGSPDQEPCDDGFFRLTLRPLTRRRRNAKRKRARMLRSRRGRPGRCRHPTLSRLTDLTKNRRRTSSCAMTIRRPKSHGRRPIQTMTRAANNRRLVRRLRYPAGRGRNFHEASRHRRLRRSRWCRSEATRRGQSVSPASAAPQAPSCRKRSPDERQQSGSGQIAAITTTDCAEFIIGRAFALPGGSIRATRIAGFVTAQTKTPPFAAGSASA
jgi:hypothetical protein